MERITSLMLLCLAAAYILSGTSGTLTEPPTVTTTTADDATDTPAPGTKEDGTNRILNYGAFGGVAGGSFGVFNDDLHGPGYPYPPPPPLPPHLPAPGPILPGHPPLLPHNSLLPSSCKYYCRGRWHNQIYCCDDSPSYPGVQCPRVRDKCPGAHYHRHLRFCHTDHLCAAGELCCLDVCVGRHVCKKAQNHY